MRPPRNEARREQALAEIEQQVATGHLTIRQMTPEERAKYGDPQPRRPRHVIRRRP